MSETKTKKKASPLRWRKPEKIFSKMVRGIDLVRDGEILVQVRYNYNGDGGWYFYGCDRNSLRDIGPIAELEDAKREARAHVVAWLKEKESK